MCPYDDDIRSLYIVWRTSLFTWAHV